MVNYQGNTKQGILQMSRQFTGVFIELMKCSPTLVRKGRGKSIESSNSPEVFTNTFFLEARGEGEGSAVKISVQKSHLLLSEKGEL